MDFDRALRKYTLVIPAHNEEGFIHRVLPVAKEWQNARPLTRHVVIVDDGSSDRTGRIAREHGMTVIPSNQRNPGKNMGKGAAIKAGVREAMKNGSDWVILADADLENLRREHLEELQSAARLDEPDMVIARRAPNFTSELFGGEEYSGERIISVEKLKPWFSDPHWRRALAGYGFEEGINGLLTKHRYVETDLRTARAAGAKGAQRIMRDIERTRTALKMVRRKPVIVPLHGSQHKVI